MPKGVNDDPPGHRRKLILAMFALTHRIAVQTTSSDLKRLQMDYLLFSYHWATFFSVLKYFSTASKMFRLVGIFYPQKWRNWDSDSMTYLRLSRYPLVVAELPKAFSKSRVRTVHAKGSEFLPPFEHPLARNSFAASWKRHVSQCPSMSSCEFLLPWLPASVVL
jgi:hypothetical protein